VYRDVRTLSGDGATVAAFLANVRNAGVVHIGVHGVGGGRSPTNALAFVEAGADHGLLDSRTIARLQLRSTRVAVLAACNSSAGGGPRERTISVARAFLAAGVPSVIGSLWNLPDREGAVLMIALHRAMAAGMTPADALREAQLLALRGSDPSLSRAAVWAGLQNFGS
jgi:CHAT domain-containing protein